MTRHSPWAAAGPSRGQVVRTADRARGPWVRASLSARVGLSAAAGAGIWGDFLHIPMWILTSLREVKGSFGSSTITGPDKRSLTLPVLHTLAEQAGHPSRARDVSLSCVRAASVRARWQVCELNCHMLGTTTALMALPERAPDCSEGRTRRRGRRAQLPKGSPSEGPR